MGMLRAYAVAKIAAPAARVYAILSDYREAHQEILPRDFFKRVEVEQGGHGAGTVVNVVSRILGREVRFAFDCSRTRTGTCAHGIECRLKTRHHIHG